jgi:hypothetical protein
VEKYYLCVTKQKAMTTLKNQTGTKAVRILTDATNSVRAAFYQIYNGSEQVLEFKTFATIKNAEKWANNKLN